MTRSTPQQLASDPRASAWVAASAGSGKTKVLTDRILNLLLLGFSPERIVCLTFTKAAAAEMAQRLNSRLSMWAFLEISLLTQELESLLGKTPTTDEISRARHLLTAVLETPGGMKIMTIHRFCQSILGRFPLEAAISPKFTILDDQEADELLTRARNRVLTENTVNWATQLLTQHTTDGSFTKALKALSHHSGDLADVIKRFPTSEKQHQFFMDFFEVPETINILHPILPQVLRSHYFLKSEDICALQENAKDHPLVKRWLDEPENRVELYPEYKRVYLTKENKPYKKPPVNDPYEIERILDVHHLITRAELAQRNWAFLALGSACLGAYATLKEQQGFLDFDDLINRTLNLLNKPGVAAWVLYKLDGGIDHLLIDEAQDTSPRQWQVIQALTAEFFTPDKPYRTIFAVGDAKQSIYSFQGARPQEFIKLRHHYAQESQLLGQSWRDVSLDVSYRSTPQILALVDAVFTNDCHNKGVILGSESIQHTPYRRHDKGLVEVWPVISEDPCDEADETGWVLPLEMRRQQTPCETVAQNIAFHIYELLKAGDILPSTKKAIQPRDILILVRKRTSFTNALIRYLQQHKVPVAGADRLLLTSHIAIQDLLALGNFLVLPDDDYSLACVLKSPMIGLTEDDLFELCTLERSNLWLTLLKNNTTSQRLKRAYTFLNDCLDKVDYSTPYELYMHVLTSCREKFIARLGHECNDPIDEFLSQALVFEQKNAATLQGFIASIEAQELEIKRDSADAQRNEVRIMTVHGSKGLQAPVVFLTESLSDRSMMDALLWDVDDAGCARAVFLRPSQDLDTPATSYLKEKVSSVVTQENQRLLYVALTRPQDRLYVCAWQNNAKDPPLTSWYHAISTAMTTLETETCDGVRRFGGVEKGAGIQEYAVRRPLTKPTWLTTPLESEPPAPREKKTLIESDAITRGLVIHKLFEVLPEFPPAKRKAVATRLFPESSQDIEHTLSILNDPTYGHLFEGDSYAEVEISYVENGQTRFGRIDRLTINGDIVSIIDYKTGHKPDTIPSSYRAQLETYASALRTTYPTHTIETYLLWVDVPCIEKVDVRERVTRVA